VGVRLAETADEILGGYFEKVRALAIPSADDSVVERARALAANGRDPERWIAEVCGYKTTPDLRKLLYALEESEEVFALGAHATGKTHYGSAYLLVVRWFIDGAEADPATGNPRGAILALVANKMEQIMATSYKALLEHGESAAARGWKLPGWEEASHKSVKWVAHSTRWFIRKETWAKETGVAEHETVGAAAGLHSSAPIIAYVEEGHKLARLMWNTIESWGPALMFSSLNPYSAGGAAKAMIDARRVRVVEHSAFRHPNVVERRPVIPGAVTHNQIDKAVADVTRCRRLGSLEDAAKLAERAAETGVPASWPAADQFDFLYAVAESDVPERGSRDDDIPGHPDGELAWYRPGPRFIAGILGHWPPDDPRRVFQSHYWTEAEELHATLERPARPPDRVGVDTAEGGPDRIMARPVWGPTCREVWERYQAALRTMGPEQALEEAMRCRECEGGGCRWCWGGREWVYFGRGEEVPKLPKGSAGAGDQELLAADLLNRFGSAAGSRPTRWFLDEGGGGYSLRPALARAIGPEASVTTVPFGGGPADLKDPPRAFVNMRAYMYGVIAAVMPLGVVAVPDTANLDQETRPLEWEVARTKALQYKLPAKAEVAALLNGRSPDDADSFALTEGHAAGGESILVYDGLVVRNGKIVEDRRAV
jgi:hypothetical protein